MGAGCPVEQRKKSSREAGMRRRPEDITLGTTACGVMLATGVAIMFVIYAMLTVIGLLPSSLVTQNLVRLAY